MNLGRHLLLLVPLLLGARVAQAESVETKERTARMACLSGDYAKGVAILSELFVDTRNYVYIYNQARCYQQSSRFAEALAHFQEYLRAGKKLSKDEKADAQKHIDECKSLLAGQPSQPPVAPPTPAPVAAPQPLPPAPAVAPMVAQQSNPRPARESGSGLRTAGIVTAAVGGAGLIAGVILNLKVNSMASDIQKVDGYTPGKESDRKNYESLGWLSYGAGAACVATGAVLYYLGLRAGSAGSTSVALVASWPPL